MTYIVKEEKELKIITVRADQEVYFQADYAGKILASGNSTLEVLLKFNELPDAVKYPDQEESSQ
jgi:lipid A disaccharide synthetase